MCRGSNPDRLKFRSLFFPRPDTDMTDVSDGINLCSTYFHFHCHALQDQQWSYGVFLMTVLLAQENP